MCLVLEHSTQKFHSLIPHDFLTPFPQYLGIPGCQLLAYITSDYLPQLKLESHLADECAQNHRTKDEVAEDARKDIPLSVDLAWVDFIEKLHQHKSVENNGVVLAGWGM